MLKLAQVQGWLDRYATALRWITKALHLLDTSDRRRPDGDSLRARLLSWYGRFSRRPVATTGPSTTATVPSRRRGGRASRSALAEALRVRIWAAMELGRLDGSADAERALAIYEELGDLAGQATSLNLLGMSAYWRGDWVAALGCYQRALAVDRRTGSPVNAVFEQYNIAEILIDQGRFDEGVEMISEVAREWRAAGYRSGWRRPRRCWPGPPPPTGSSTVRCELLEEAVDGVPRDRQPGRGPRDRGPDGRVPAHGGGRTRGGSGRSTGGRPGPRPRRGVRPAAPPLPGARCGAGPARVTWREGWPTSTQPARPRRPDRRSTRSH